MAKLKELFGERVDLGPAGHLDLLAREMQESTSVQEVTVHKRDGGTYIRHQRVSTDDGDHEQDVSHVEPEHHGKAARVAAKVLQTARELAVRLTPAAMKVGQALGVVLDTPDDMKKFAYNPTTSSGTANVGHDPVKAGLTDALGVGVSGHIVASAVAFALSHAVTWAKRRISGATEDADNGVMEWAEYVHNLYAAAYEHLGLDAEPPSVSALAERISALLS